MGKKEKEDFELARSMKSNPDILNNLNNNSYHHSQWHNKDRLYVYNLTSEEFDFYNKALIDRTNNYRLLRKFMLPIMFIVAFWILS